jgi:hypothetical protein
MSTNPGFGPRMIGEAAYAEQQTQASTGGAGFGSRMTGSPVPVAQPAPPLAAVTPDAPQGSLADGSYSVADVRAMLADAPARTYDLAEAEFNRADGPRVTVVRLLRETEAAKGDEARLALITVLDQHLGE